MIEAVLNHVSGSKAGIAGVYNKAQHLPERRTALVAWSHQVLDLVDNRERKVVPMRL